MGKKTVNDFSRQEIRTIAQEYATLGLELSHSYFQEKYGISEGTFYGILAAAVVKHIVDKQTCLEIATKAEANSLVKGGEGGANRSKSYHLRLWVQRRNFKFSPKVQQEIAEEYAKSDLFKEEFCVKYAMTTTILGKTLQAAIINNMIDDDAVQRIRRKAISGNWNKNSTIKFFDSLMEEREKRQKQA